MIKFTAAGNGFTLVGIGLGEENVKRMQEGHPVEIKFSDLDFTGALASVRVMIFTGKDADSMKADLAPLLSKATVIRDER